MTTFRANNIFIGNALPTLKTLADETYQSVITSPPYFRQRDYGHADQIGLEHSRDEYIAALVAVFSEIRRTLKDDGTVWLNISDTYLKKSLMMIPARLAIALADDGWIIRQDIVWSKPNPMPEPAPGRCVRAHEYIFLLSKKSKYQWNALRERGVCVKAGAFSANTKANHGIGRGNTGLNAFKARFAEEIKKNGFGMRNRRSVWECQIRASRHKHFATFPEALIEPMIAASTNVGDLILDPFGGSGTTAVVAYRMGRQCDLIELNPAYAGIAKNRLWAEVQERRAA